MKPSSIGNFDEALIVMNDEEWDGQLGDTLRYFLNQPYQVLPQYEPVFNLRQKSTANFSQLFKKSTTILIIGALDRDDKTSAFLKKSLGEKNTQTVMRKKKFFQVTRHDVWAAPQLVIYMVAPDQKTLIEGLERNHKKLIQLIQATELERILAYIKGRKEDKKIRELISRKFNASLFVPAPYQVAREKDSLLWIREMVNQRDGNILIRTVAAKGVETVTEELAIQLINELGKQEIEGELKGTYLRTDTTLSPDSKGFFLQGKPALETRGIWRLEGDFMGGPFINYLILDKKKGKITQLFGFVYAPEKKKRKYMREMKALFGTWADQI